MEKNWLLEIYNLPINKRADDACQMFSNVLASGAEYLDKFTNDLIEYRVKKKREEFEYKAKIE